MKLKITLIGNSFGVILPKEALAKLKVTGGDAVFITETPDGFQIPHMTRNLKPKCRRRKE